MSGFGGTYWWLLFVGGPFILTAVGAYTIVRRSGSLGGWLLGGGALMIALGQLIDALRMVAAVNGHFPLIGGLTITMPYQLTMLAIRTSLALFLIGGTLAPIGLFLLACTHRVHKSCTSGR